MPRAIHVLIAAALLTSAARAGDEEYKLGPDSVRHEGVPRGTVTKDVWRSKIFPNTVRDYWVYVPAQYDGSKPACVMVFQDGVVSSRATPFQGVLPGPERRARR